MRITQQAVRTAAAGVLAAATLAGCKNFLTSDQAINNPNQPTTASASQSLTAIEINQYSLQSGDPARTIGLWMQQFSGTQNQYVSTAQYDLTEDFTNGFWGTIYQGGGLVDLRSVETRSDAAGDSVTAGIARVLEAYAVGTAADWWGDVPYSNALVVGTPATLDKQADVYAAVQTTLDRAIKQLASGAGAGPSGADLLYGGSATKWIAAAYTLKARFYLHTAEAKGTAADGTPNFTAAAYTSALAAAQKGIASATNDLRTYQSSSPTAQNLWYQFTVLARAGYLSPSDYFVNLLKARSDPRLTTYFAPGDGATAIVGATTQNGVPSGTATLNGRTGNPGAPDYAQPLVTYAENQLIIAEAQFRLGNAGAALTAYNAERTSAGATTLSALPTGAAGLNEIMTEKYVALFQSPEIWSDYRRTCLPVRTPVAGASGLIPARFTYPLSERGTNPNIPSISDQPLRNANDPNPCFVGATQVSN